MNVLKISWLLFKNNLKLYRFYLLVLILVTAIYYNFLAVYYNPYLKVLSEQYIFAQAASILSSIILFITMLSFMFHANNFFYKLRYKEIGTYMLMGVPVSRIGMVFALESILLGGIAVIIGLPIGLLFSKLFFMMMAKAMILNTHIPFYISQKAICTLILIMAFIIFLTGLKNYFTVYKSKLIEVLNAVKKEESLPKIRWLCGLSGISFILAAYYLALNILDLPFDLPLNFSQASILILMLACTGTYFFFGSFLAIILNWLIGRKNIIYKGARLISFSNTLFRLRTHYKSMAMTAILCAATLASLGGSLALKHFADVNVLIEAPYSISFINQDETTKRRIISLIQESDHEILAEHESRFIKGKVMQENKNVAENCLVTGYSEVKKALMITRPRDYNEILRDIEPGDKETVRILHSNLIFSGLSYTGQDFVIQGRHYKLKKDVKIPFVGDIGGIGNYDIYILSDKQYEELREDAEEIILHGINITNPKHSMPLVSKIAGVMKNPGDNLSSFVWQYQYKYYLIGVLFFAGLILSIVFMISTFTTAYFKILSDAVLDKEQYKILVKIGMTEREMAGSIYTQVAIALFLPLLLGIIHGVMAIKAFETFLHYKFTGSILSGVIILITFMSGWYAVLCKSCRSIIMRSGNL